jgi:hypothetical protein
MMTQQTSAQRAVRHARDDQWRSIETTPGEEGRAINCWAAIIPTRGIGVLPSREETLRILPSYAGMLWFHKGWSTMNQASVRTLILAWTYGLICGLGIASTVVGVLRGEGMPGVLWPGLTPLLLAPLLILRLIDRQRGQETR